MHIMASNEVDHGPVSRRVVANVKRLRNERSWSLDRLSEELRRVGRPILPTGLSRLERGSRRIDVDDLVGLALALDVAPIALLLPPTTDGPVQLTDEITAAAEDAWKWIRGIAPLSVPKDDDGFALLEFHRRSMPRALRSWVALQTSQGWQAMADEQARMAADPDFARSRIPRSMWAAFGLEEGADGGE